MKRLFLIISLAIIMAPPFTAIADDSLKLEFSEDRALISGFGPGANIAVFVASWSDMTPGPALRPHSDILRDKDHDGFIEIQTDEGHLAYATMIVACDMRTGALAFGRPGPIPLRKLDNAVLANGPGGNDGEIVISNVESIDILLVKLNRGFWHTRIFDDSNIDSDGRANASITFNIDDLDPVGTPVGNPRDPGARNLIFIVDPFGFGIQELEMNK